MSTNTSGKENKPSSLKKAEALVRARLPKLLELSCGCEISHRGLQETGDSVNTEGVYIADSVGMNWYTANGNIFPILREHIEIIGHSVKLSDYLKVILQKYEIDEFSVHPCDDNIIIVDLTLLQKDLLIAFNLTTGAPATENDAVSFIKLVEEV
jgi:hypothetical protein